ncbi:hypothetical protein [Deinococcus metallilatus]|uniref:Uncharacterized protein n=1 Tax=Deinococcus metallilatus TaxID=1211322 RepID=A0AAJ5F037_9DEIO|nr:hypothetical protein [Deinococcus metallilatus]MBB5297422.1 hypothetical protein [Deinococcus metallilatus]RXJ08062.1 hypothetical protein ERJ73_19480 [Deinococcus metallilatus]TLK20828.1 hypothetical protein FCS05_19860 [Deinococcus metallilatus]GMA17016.1 hypothetical protein GCM10025871_33470 [Deinococcus metallilatus]
MFDLKELLGQLVADEFKGIGTLTAKSISNLAANKLKSQEQKTDYKLNWSLEIERLPSVTEKLSYAVGNLWSVRSLNCLYSGERYTDSDDFKRRVTWINVVVGLPVTLLYLIYKDEPHLTPLQGSLIITGFYLVASMMGATSLTQLRFFIASLKSEKIDLSFKERLQHLHPIISHTIFSALPIYLIFNCFKTMQILWITVGLCALAVYCYVAIKGYELEKDEVSDLIGVKL